MVGVVQVPPDPRRERIAVEYLIVQQPAVNDDTRAPTAAPTRPAPRRSMPGVMPKYAIDAIAQGDGRHQVEPGDRYR